MSEQKQGNSITEARTYARRQGFLFCLLIGLSLLVAPGCLISSRRLPSVKSLNSAGLVEPTQKVELLDARRIAIVDCTDCHRVYWPSEFEQDEWPGIIRNMGKRAGLSNEERDSLLEYYQLSNELISLEKAKHTSAK